MFSFVIASAITLSRPTILPLDSAKGLKAEYGVTLSSTTYRGKRAVELTEEFDPVNGGIAVLPGVDFANGDIDLDVAARLTENAGQGARGFVGIAFRGADDMSRYENFYLRMTNGRSPDQELRNHAVQYCSVPDYTWDLLRQKRPSRYEAYTDLELGAWTHIKISVNGSDAKFYVGGATQPTLVVHGLLGKQEHGKLALWVHAHTHAYFANLVVRPA